MCKDIRHVLNEMLVWSIQVFMRIRSVRTRHSQHRHICTYRKALLYFFRIWYVGFIFPLRCNRQVGTERLQPRYGSVLIARVQVEYGRAGWHIDGWMHDQDRTRLVSYMISGYFMVRHASFSESSATQGLCSLCAKWVLSAVCYQVVESFIACAILTSCEHAGLMSVWKQISPGVYRAI